MPALDLQVQQIFAYKYLGSIWLLSSIAKPAGASLACLPAQSPLPLLPPWQKALGLAVGLGMSRWQDSTESSHAGGDYSSLMKSGMWLSVSALFPPVGKRDWRDLL